MKYSKWKKKKKKLEDKKELKMLIWKFGIKGRNQKEQLVLENLMIYVELMKSKMKIIQN